ncbi:MULTISPECIES: glycosyltransferase family 2 protein [Mesorhizobium]|uniref:glycosyltransferase family 2 protein n=1 Tax=Mesorhizobium TaxID=68287 RepID=UPI0003CF447C|nr:MULTISPECIES: glycosyltransferase family 2 protein [Mesorhizobium]ESY69789.1 glycosyl transferase family 2 [Mesorhizobium sp. LNHC232B00]WJI39576.1 glycosyltransferase family 2 protein [Mesorhizobium opportunistum]
MQIVSIVVPVKDEQDTVRELIVQIEAAFQQIDGAQASLKEIIFVDDGSQDNTWKEILSATLTHPCAKGIRLRRNFGKAAALQAGISSSVGNIIVTMDGDLQDDPKEISRFLDEIHAGSDVVSGWKQVRHDPLGKTLPSKLFNRATAKVSGVALHDFNCGFKAYRREVFNNISLYGELHRFIPALAHATGFKVSEIIVQHRPRRFGKSKYGIGRLLKGFLDLLTVVTITKFNSRPGHLFGGLGVAVIAVGFAIFLYLCARWFGGEAIGGRPLLLVSTLLMIVGVQFTLFGMVAELIVATRSDDRDAGIIAEIASSEGGLAVKPIDARVER